MSFSVGMQTIRERFAKAMGITGGQYSLLVAVPHLESRQVPVTVSSLAKYMHVSGTYVTAECNKLEGAGYLCRHSHPDDRRSMLLSLTDEGRRLIESVLPALRLVNDEIFRGLTRGEFRTLCRLMGGLAVSIGDAVLISESYSRKIERAHNG